MRARFGDPAAGRGRPGDPNRTERTPGQGSGRAASEPDGERARSAARRAAAPQFAVLPESAVEKRQIGFFEGRLDDVAPGHFAGTQHDPYSHALENPDVRRHPQLAFELTKFRGVGVAHDPLVDAS